MRAAISNEPIDLAPNAEATVGINLRLNAYELVLLRKLAAAHNRSLDKTIRRLLIPAVESAVRRLNA